MSLKLPPTSTHLEDAVARQNLRKLPIATIETRTPRLLDSGKSLQLTVMPIHLPISPAVVVA